MKRIGIYLGLIVIVVSVFLFVNKTYYTPLLVDHLSAKEAIKKLKESDAKIVEIATDSDYIWYITRTENEGILITDDHIKQMVSSKGWEFKEKDGAGLFFEKDGEILIITTQMWTKKYVLVKAQKKLLEV